MVQSSKLKTVAPYLLNKCDATAHGGEDPYEPDFFIVPMSKSIEFEKLFDDGTGIEAASVTYCDDLTEQDVVDAQPVFGGLPN